MFTPKNIVFDDAGRSKLRDGITKMSNAVKSTLGPSGQTVLIESESHTHGITVTKDGVTVAKSIHLMDAVENCVVYCANFDPEKSKNPFSYFTQVCWYAFIRRIGKEKRQIEICDKIISKSGYEAFFEGDALGSSSDYNSIKDSVDQRRKGNK